MIRNTNIVVFALTLLLVLSSATAQAARGIYGTINDASGGPISGVTIRIDGSAFKTLSAKDGSYDLDYVPGDIKVLFSKRGYLPYILRLSIAQKMPYPAQEIKLKRIPYPINWLGETVAGATVKARKSNQLGSRGEFFDFSSAVGEDGWYELPVVEGDVEVVITAQNFGDAKYSINIGQQKLPKGQSILMMPASPGLYYGEKKLSAVDVQFDKTEMEPYRGNLVIPRIPAIWEGDYYAKGDANKMDPNGETLDLYYYPNIPATIGASPLAARHAVAVLNPGLEGLIAKLGSKSGEFQKAEVEVITITERETWQHSLIYQPKNLYLLRVPFTPETLVVVCDWTQDYGSLGGLFHPGERAWILRGPNAVTAEEKEAILKQAMTIAEEAIKCFLDEEFEKCLAKAQESLEICPTASGYFAKAIGTFGRKEYEGDIPQKILEDSLAATKAGLREFPDYYLLNFFEAQLYTEIELHEQAVSTLKRLVESGRDDPQVLGHLALNYAKLGSNLDEALRLGKKAESRGDKEQAAFHNSVLAECYFAREEHKKALRYNEKALKDEPDNVDYIDQKKRIERALGKS